MDLDHDYNGWANWHTWNVYNWLSNDESFYDYATSIVDQCSPIDCAFYLRDVLMVVDEEYEFVGYRDGIDPGMVDWDQIIKAFRSEVV